MVDSICVVNQMALKRTFRACKEWEMVKERGGEKERERRDEWEGEDTASCTPLLRFKSSKNALCQGTTPSDIGCVGCERRADLCSQFAPCSHHDNHV